MYVIAAGSIPRVYVKEKSDAKLAGSLRKINVETKTAFYRVTQRRNDISIGR